MQPTFRFMALSLLLAATAAAAPVRTVWPPWLSIESPVNPYDPATRGAALLVRTFVREGGTSAADLTGSAEGLVGAARRSVALTFDATAYPGVYALRRQWPKEGTWMLRITLMGHTTALVTLDRGEGVASVRVATRVQSTSGIPLPRDVAMREIDSTLTAMAAK